MSEEMPDWPQALLLFRWLLADSNPRIPRFSDRGRVQWVFREDVAVPDRDGRSRPTVYVRHPLPDREDDVRARYEAARDAGAPGVCLRVLGVRRRRPLAYIVIPADEIDASYRMIGGLTIGIHAPPHRVRAVHRSSAWRRIQHRERTDARHTTWIDDIPRRFGQRWPDGPAGDDACPWTR